MNIRTDIDEQKEQIIEWLVKENITRADIAARLGCKYDTLRSRLDKWGLSEFKFEGRNSGGSFPYKTLEEYLDGKETVHGHVVVKKLIRDKYKKAECEICKLSVWLGKPIPLHLDHIDGNRYNNTLDNFRILCPNCHAQTDTYAGKNIGSYTKN